jgi:TonB family protein
MMLRLLFQVFSFATVLSSITAIASAQVQAIATRPPETDVVLTKLSQPVYPVLARQAQIGGDVELKLSIRQDGSVESAETISGHPMLTQAASVSAQKSQFECRNCSGPENSYSMTYTFKPGQYLGECTDSNYELMQQGKSELTMAQGHVTLVAGPVCSFIDNVVIGSKARTVKCLYLWKCGFR